MTVYKPVAVGEVMDRLSVGAVPMAGGTDLMVKLRSAGETSDLVLLDGVESLKWISLRGNDLVVGAAATWQRIIDSPLISKEAPLLVMAAFSVGGPALRHMGTIGGNLCTASPAGDGVCALWALGASLEIRGVEGSRMATVEEFVKGPGKNCLEPGELLTSIRVPLRPGWLPFFRKDGLRRAMAIAVGSCSVVWKPSEDGSSVEKIRMALGSMGPRPVRSVSAESVMTGANLSDEAPFRAAGEILSREVEPIDDIRASATYRRKLALSYPRIFRLSNR